MMIPGRFVCAAAVLLLAARPSAAQASAPDAAQTARLDLAATLTGALDRPAKLARLCLDAHLACGFELRADVWKRPEAKRRIPSATVSQALAVFMGKDYRLAWRDGVLLVAPVVSGPAPLDAEVSAGAGGETPAGRAGSLRAVARKTGLRLTVAGKPPVRRSPGTGGPAPMTATARRILGLWDSPAQDRPNVWVAVYSRDGRSGRLYWFWGEGRAGKWNLKSLQALHE
jgi:hypothetical protein